MDFNTNLNLGIKLLIKSVAITFQIKDWYLPSIHFWNSVYGRCYVLQNAFIFLLCFMIVCWFIFDFCLYFHVP